MIAHQLARRLLIPLLRALTRPCIDCRCNMRFVTDDIAIIACAVNETVVADGKTMPLKANDASVWVRIRAGINWIPAFAGMTMLATATGFPLSRE